MNFFRDVVSHLLKNAFEGHTKFSVADNTAVGASPIRSISLDAVPVNNETIISLSWDGGEKLFEKTLSEQEAPHQFELISSDLAEVAALTKQGEYDSAKALMQKLGQKYAENTGDIVDTNLPALHNTQASADDHLLKQAKITMQNLWFSTPDELLEYQEKQKGAAKPGDQDHIPLWDKNKGAKPKGDSLAPASLSYEDKENQKAQEHEDMQKHIDEKIKTELESALQQKAASVFGPDQVELVQVLKKNGRNWDEIKKILVKDFGFEKDSVNIFVDEQRQGSDPAGIEVEPVKEDKKEDAPLTPPEELVSPETHDKLLQDHEDKKKGEPPLDAPKEQNFTPKDVMDIPEDEAIQDESALVDEIARADNDEIHKIAAPTDLNPLQEPIKEAPTTPSQDVVPMGKKPLDHEAPQKGDRVFVASDMADEKAGFEGTFVSTYQSEGRDHYVVETDEGDLLDVDAHRVTKISENGGAQTAEPSMEPEIAGTQPEQAIPTTPKMSDFHAEQAMALKKEAELLLAFAKEADEQTTFWDERSYDEKYPMMAKHPDMVDPMIEAVKKYGDNWNRIENDLFYKYPYYMMNMSHAAGSRDGLDMIKEVENWLQEQESTDDKVFVPRKYEQTEAFLKDEAIRKQAIGNKLSPKDVCDQCEEALAIPGKGKCADCLREFMSVHTEAAEKCKCGHAHSGDVCDDCKCSIHHEASLAKEADPVDPAKTKYKDYKITPKYAPKEEAVPATPEIDAVLTKMANLEQNLATLESARQQIAAKMQEEMAKVDQSGNRVEMEAALQESIEKAAVLISAVNSKVVQWKDKLYTLQTEEISYVPKLTPKEMLAKVYAKFDGAEKYVQDVLNGMLSQAKNVMENTLIRWPNKKSSLNKEATILDDMNHYNDELMAALKELSSPL